MSHYKTTLLMRVRYVQLKYSPRTFEAGRLNGGKGIRAEENIYLISTLFQSLFKQVSFQGGMKRKKRETSTLPREVRVGPGRWRGMDYETRTFSRNDQLLSRSLIAP